MSKKDFTKHLSLFTHPQVVQNRYDFIGMLVTKELTFDFHSIGGGGGCLLVYCLLSIV